MNKCFAVISLILKLKAAGMSNVIYACNEIQDIIKPISIIKMIVKEISMTFQKCSGSIYFTGLEIAILKFHDFPRFFMAIQTLNVTIGYGSLNQKI